MSGQSIAAASDAISRNGKRNTTYAWALIVGGSVIVPCAVMWIRYELKKKEKRENSKLMVQLENTKHKNRLEETKQENELKKSLIDHRRQTRQESTFTTNVEVNPNVENASVQTYDEVVSGEDTPVDNLRLGLRCFHIGEDCGLIGRTQIGKTSWVLQYSMALARGFQENNAKLAPDWKLNQPMTVLYFAFEQDQTFFRAKYGKVLKSVPNLYVDVKTNACDFEVIQKKISKMQSTIGERRLLVVFDNITMMKCRGNKDKRVFFGWLEDYRRECASEGIPITYLKIYHTLGSYKDSMPLDATTNYGAKTDAYFTQSLVGFGMCKEGDGKMRYIKELKNKIEQDGEKQSLSIYQFADAEIPLFDYVGEADERDILPSKADLVRGTGLSVTGALKRGRKEKYTEEELQKVFEMYEAGTSWREIFEQLDQTFTKNKKRALQEALKRHGFRKQ